MYTAESLTSALISRELALTTKETTNGIGKCVPLKALLLDKVVAIDDFNERILVIINSSNLVPLGSVFDFADIHIEFKAFIFVELLFKWIPSLGSI